MTTVFGQLGQVLRYKCAAISVFTAVGVSLPAPCAGADNVYIDNQYQSIDGKSFVRMVARWRLAKIPVCWENPAAISVADRDYIRSVIADTWEKESCLQFLSWGACNPTTEGIRILIKDQTPASTVGQENNVAHMTLNVTFLNYSPQYCTFSDQNRQTCLKATSVHEFGHALAFAHEQNRDDTPATCNAAPQGPDGTRTLTPWDPDSIMNYCNVHWTNARLSDGDIYGLRKAYCAPGGQLP